jgi:polysaccharide deacetylase family sporulation protein PdaB
MSKIKRIVSFSLVFVWLLSFCIRALDVPNVYSSCENNAMQIALTFDDGPHPVYTPKILEILEKYQIPATFFMIGENVASYPSLVKKVFERGHEIGNHTYSHPKLNRCEKKTLHQELQRTDQAIFEAVDCHPTLFRPPEGFCNELLAKQSAQWGYKVILWNIDTRDWAHTPVENIVSYVKKNVKSGDILLFHDYIAKDSPTPKALEILIPYLLEEGYQFVTVSELLRNEA